MLPHLTTELGLEDVNSGDYHNVQACGGQMGKKEKLKSLSIMTRDGTGDPRVERGSLL